MAAPTTTSGPSRLNWTLVLLRFLLLYVLTWIGVAAWMTYAGQGGFGGCLLHRTTVGMAALWAALLAGPFFLILGILGALASRELAMRWKVLVVVLVGIASFEGEWILSMTRQGASPWWWPMLQRAVSGSHQRSARRPTPAFALETGTQSPAQLESLQQGIRVLMDGLKHYQHPGTFYDLDAQTETALRNARTPATTNASKANE